MAVSVGPASRRAPLLGPRRWRGGRLGPVGVGGGGSAVDIVVVGGSRDSEGSDSIRRVCEEERE